MFQFPAFACLTACRIFNAAGCPIRKSADLRSFAPTRGLSQLITSFIASESQGIHHTPLVIYFVAHVSLHAVLDQLFLLLLLLLWIIF